MSQPATSVADRLPPLTDVARVQGIAARGGAVFVAALTTSGKRARLLRAEAGGWRTLIDRALGGPGFGPFALGQAGDPVLATTLDGQVLVSADGEAFVTLDPPLPFTAVGLSGGRIFGGASTTPGPAVYVSGPVGGAWVPASAEGPSADGLRTVTALAPLDDSLHVCLADPEAGFEVWRAEAQGGPPYAWVRVIERGAYRYTLSRAVSALARFQGRLVLGSSVVTPPSVEQLVGAPELIQLDARGDWEILVGAPRFSPAGLKVPVSAQPAGFGVRCHAAFAALAADTGTLWAALQPIGVDSPSLWATTDGIAWSQVSAPEVEGLAEVTALAATGESLLVGGVNRQHAGVLVRVEAGSASATPGPPPQAAAG
jgi:hypothetical protein